VADGLEIYPASLQFSQGLVLPQRRIQMANLDDSVRRVTKILLRAQDDANALLELEQFRRTLVVMFSDIQGSTAYFEKHGDAAGLFMVRQCNDTIRQLVEKYGGTVIKTIGDGSMATFPEARNAVQTAIEIQNALAHSSNAASEEDRVAVRIGMHYGTGIVGTNDVFGDVVNVAARVESVAKPRQIVLSEEVYEQVRECGFNILRLGRFALKGKTGERTLFRVKLDQDQDTNADSGVEAAAPVSSHVFKLQALTRGGDVAAEYTVHAELGIQVLADGKLNFCSDLHPAPLCARVFVEGEQLFIEQVETQGVGIFVRLSGAHVLEDRDILVAGKQTFRYEENHPATSWANETATVAVADLLPPANAATLTRIESGGKSISRYPLSAMQVQFGRTRGDHVFAEDNLMSRAHMKISQRGEDFVVEDLGSRNGTFVKVSRKTPLAAGSVLIISGQLLKVEG
jgi:class 3 adenylate cyclase